MSESREIYQLQGADLAEIIQHINFILSRMADRLDKLEGIRGTSEIQNLSVPAAIGFFSTAPTTQQSKISDPSGGGTVDTEARAAINAIIDVLEAYGLTDD